MRKLKLLTSTDGRCPYCESHDVVRVGKISPVGASSTTNLPKLNMTIWHCRKCDAVFRYEGE